MNLDQAAALLEQRKIELARAQSAVLDAERAVLAILPAKAEGTVSSAGQSYKVTVTFGVNRTVDAAALSAIRPKVAHAMFDQAFEYAPKIKLAGLRYLRNNEPEAYAALAQAITAKPAKPSVKVERIENEAAKAA